MSRRLLKYEPKVDPMAPEVVLQELEAEFSSIFDLVPDDDRIEPLIVLQGPAVGDE
jgi:hypothetical protein